RPAESLSFFLNRLSFEKQIGPELFPFGRFIEGDNRIDHLVRKFVKRAVYGIARGYAITLLDDLLTLLGQHEIDEQHGGVRMRRALCHPDRVRAAEGGR